MNARLSLGSTAFQYQRDSLQELSICGVGAGIRVDTFNVDLSKLRALRTVAMQNVGLGYIHWLANWNTSTPATLDSLSLDCNPLMKLCGAATAALISMTALQTLSMQKHSADGGTSGDSGAATRHG